MIVLGNGTGSLVVAIALGIPVIDIQQNVSMKFMYQRTLRKLKR
jgi:hypothetical protein